ncbi:Nif11-like leader peptide family RiPP precursor [Nostoc sp.]|uniref:Nif11-like leader peptide family RiPP precursor n=1 Tax=Nostoc sp. TaxID=1180 RepID=UPI002FF7E6A5
MSQKVVSLLAAAFENPTLQQQLHTANTPESFVKIAAENGYKLTQEELATALGKVHVVFGEVVQSMLSQLVGAPATNGKSSTTEKISGTNVDMVKRLFSRGEAFDSEGFITFFSDTPVYHFGNFEVCLDKESIKKSADNFFSKISAVYHEIKMMWEEGDVVFVEMDVLYWRKDGSMVSLPCTDIFRIEGDKFSELRIFMDVNPVFDPTIPVLKSASVLTGSQGKQLLPPGIMRQHFAEHSEGKERVKQGFVPKWSIAGPKWPIGSEPVANGKLSQQLQAMGELAQAVIAQDWEKVKTYLTDDIFYKVGSGEPVYGPQAVVDFFARTFKNTAVFYGHDVRKIWQEPDIITLEMDAKYELVPSKQHVKIACCDIYRLRGNKVSEWRVYADMSPWEIVKMATISDQAGLLTVINVFTVQPEQQQRLVDFFIENKEIPMKQPGFISANIHKSLDSTRVVNYIQWSNREALESASKNPDFIAMTKQAAEFASHDFHAYEVVLTVQAQ